jgi:hypothetical protein
MDSDLFTYIVILIIFLAVFNYFSESVTLALVLGLILAVILIYYLYYEKKENYDTTAERNDFKFSETRPPSGIIKNYPEFNDFFFSIQEFYAYSPMNYEDMIDSIEDFLILYENIKINPKLAGKYYELAEKKKSDALNALHGVIFSTEVTEGGAIINKNDRARRELEYILSSYLDEMLTELQNYNKTHGITINTKLNTPVSWPKASNYFMDLDPDFNDGRFGNFTYELY